MNSILITGGAGFIGSHLTRWFVNKYPHYKIVNLDLLTYAGNLSNLSDIEDSPNYKFIKGDICDMSLLDRIFKDEGIDAIIHCAAESHVDRSIHDPLSFIRTNVYGTGSLLVNARKHWDSFEGKIFYHISTDEVYGTLGSEGYFNEETPYDPRSPYSASKASSDHLVRSFYHTYGLPIKISNCSNNYGPYHFPEKLIPLIINNILNEKPLPVYGKGENVRDWLYVEDHVRAIDLVFHEGRVGETYNIGGSNEWRNIDLVKEICRQMDEKLGREAQTSEKLITFVKDRPGHDLRYAIDASKIKTELGWEPSYTFEKGISVTIDWFLANREWLNRIVSGDYMSYYETMYVNR